MGSSDKTDGPRGDEELGRHSNPTLAQPKSERDETIEGGLEAWVLLIGSFFMIFNTWGIVNSYGVYQEYYASSLLMHTSASSISWIGTVQGCLLEIIGIVVGPAYDMGHFRLLIYTGSLLVVFGTMMLSLCTKYWQIFLAQSICIGLGSGIVLVPSISVITAKFNKHRAIAIGIASSGSSVGGVIYPIVFRELQPRFGFAWATRVMGFMALAAFLLSFAAFSWYKVESKEPRALFDARAFRELPFMSYTIGLTVLYAGFFVPFFYIPTYATKHLGTSLDLAFYLLAITNAGAFVGRLLPGILPKYLAQVESLLLSVAGGGLLVMAWIAVSNVGGLVTFCVLYGIFSGIIITMANVMVPELTPPEAFHETIGTRVGMTYFGTGVGLLIGSPIAGAASDTTKGNLLGAQLFGGLALVGGASILVYPWMAVRRRVVKPG